MELRAWLKLNGSDDQWDLWKTQGGLQLLILNINSPDGTWSGVRVPTLTVIWMASYQQAEMLYRLRYPSDRRRAVECASAYQCIIPDSTDDLISFCHGFMSRLLRLETMCGNLGATRIRTQARHDFDSAYELSTFIQTDMVTFYKSVRHDFHHSGVHVGSQNRKPTLADCFLVLDLVSFSNNGELINVVMKVGAREDDE